MTLSARRTLKIVQIDYIRLAWPCQADVVNLDDVRGYSAVRIRRQSQAPWVEVVCSVRARLSKRVGSPWKSSCIIVISCGYVCQMRIRIASTVSRENRMALPIARLANVILHLSPSLRFCLHLWRDSGSRTRFTPLGNLRRFRRSVLPYWGECVKSTRNQKRSQASMI